MPRPNQVGGRALVREQDERARKEQAERAEKAKAEPKKVESAKPRGGK